jgi:hypothetical protein
LGGRNIDLNKPSIHCTEFRRRNVFSFQLHLGGKRPNLRGSFLNRRFAAIGC